MIPVRCETELEIRALPDDGEWALTAPLVWTLVDEDFELLKYPLTIPKGFITDLASIPRVLQSVLSVTGKSRRAAVAHDYLYCRQTLSREAADEFLRSALIAEGMHPTEARIYWLGVRIGGWVPWNARKRRGGGLFPDDFYQDQTH